MVENSLVNFVFLESKQSNYVTENKCKYLYKMITLLNNDLVYLKG